MDVELTTTPSADDARIISEGLINFNSGEVADLELADEIEFSVFARDEDGSVIGGLRATCHWNTLHIEAIWLPESVRGGGIGSALVQEAERFAINHGFGQALLETTSWQAKPFYEKLGYDLMATLPHYPKGHDMHFMTKKLCG